MIQKISLIIGIEFFDEFRVLFIILFIMLASCSSDKVIILEKEYYDIFRNIAKNNLSLHSKVLPTPSQKNKQMVVTISQPIILISSTDEKITTLVALGITMKS